MISIDIFTYWFAHQFTSFGTIFSSKFYRKHQFGFNNKFRKIHLISDKLPGPLFLDGWMDIYLFSKLWLTFLLPGWNKKKIQVFFTLKRFCNNPSFFDETLRWYVFIGLQWNVSTLFSYGPFWQKLFVKM